jgi:ABC-2 type transport system ATP-binding protein
MVRLTESLRPSSAERGITAATGGEHTAAVDAVAVRGNDLARRFGATSALAGVSIAVQAGEVHALLGPNGAGKTTLLRLVTGMLEPDAGSVNVLGLDPFRSPREVRRRIGVVTSGTRSFYLRISGFENLLFFGRLQGLRRDVAASRALAALDAVDLSAAAHAPAATYSTGMQRRLAMARATLHEPEVLLIDEATHDLDPEASARVRELVSQAASRGVAVLWTTQRLEEIRGFADAVTLLDAGRVRFVGTVPQLLVFAQRRQYLITLDGTDGEQPPEQLLCSGAYVASLVAAGDGSTPDFLLTLERDAVLSDAFVALSERGWRVTGCSDARASVEDAFLSLLSEARG